MNIKRWIARREADWKQLENLLKRVETRGIGSLQADEIRHMASLYRSVSADLARMQTHQVSSTLQHNLQQLTVRSYSQIYQGSRRQEWQGVLRFYWQGFPAVVQASAGYIALATALFLLGAVVAWWYAWQDPEFMGLLVPEGLISKVRDRGELWMGSIVGVEPLASSQIMQNNLSVSFAAIGGGITAGLYTAYIMVYNGLHIGAIATLVGQNNLAYPFWAFVFPHGSIELPAIFMAGAAGLLIGKAILFPGRYYRAEALRQNGIQAAQLLFGIVPMLVIAGIIEGFVSPNPAIPDIVKYVLGTGIFSLLLWYCCRNLNQHLEARSEVISMEEHT
jgi:uncharacterized membrane protein SpoIIM required for sporulation